MTHTLFVCTTCASTWEGSKRVGTSGGEHLLASLSALHADWDLRDEFAIAPVSCMSACSRPCTVTFAAPGKHTFVFGDLAADPEARDANAAAVLECARQYYHKPDGLLAWAQRPAPMKAVVARVPPVPSCV